MVTCRGRTVRSGQSDVHGPRVWLFCGPKKRRFASVKLRAVLNFMSTFHRTNVAWKFTQLTRHSFDTHDLIANDIWHISDMHVDLITRIESKTIENIEIRLHLSFYSSFVCSSIIARHRSIFYKFSINCVVHAIGDLLCRLIVRVRGISCPKRCKSEVLFYWDGILWGKTGFDILYTHSFNLEVYQILMDS